MNTYRVTFYSVLTNSTGKQDSQSMWVGAQSEALAIMEATTEALIGDDNTPTDKLICGWIMGNLVQSVYAVIETN